MCNKCANPAKVVISCMVVDFAVLKTNPMAEIEFRFPAPEIGCFHENVRLSKQWKFAIDIPLLSFAKAV
jgi:hypothetical protein